MHGFSSQRPKGKLLFLLLHQLAYKVYSVSLERMDELFGTADLSGVDDVGVAAQKGDMEKAHGVHIEQVRT